MTVLKVAPYKAPETIEIDGSLESMQAIVGGLIQAIYPFEEPVALICNDEGKLCNLEKNRALYSTENAAVYDVICGTFFVCGVSTEAAEFTSLTPEQIKTYTELFYSPEIILEAGNSLLVLKL